MCVAAQLDRQAGFRGVLQVGSHDLGCAAIEGECRDHHAPVANRDKVLLARCVLRLEQRDRVRAAGRRRPAFVTGWGNLIPQCLAGCLPFLDAWMRDRGCTHHYPSPLTSERAQIPSNDSSASSAL